MEITAFLKSLFGKESTDKQKNLFVWKVNPFDEVEFFYDQQYQTKLAETAKKNPLFGFQLSYLSALKDEYDVNEFPNGFSLPTGIIPTLDENFQQLFALPSMFNGKLIAEIQGELAQSAFSLKLFVQFANGEKISHYELEGCFLKLAENERYSLTLSQYQALKAVQHHQQLPPEKRGEYENSWLIFQLQLAKKGGAEIDLKHFEKLEILSPEKIGVAIQVLPNGDFELIPTFKGGDVDEIKIRTGQLTKGKSCVLRVKDRFVLFDDTRLEAIKDLLQNPKIKKEQVAKFLENPTAWLDANLIDLDTGFSLRVFGAEKFVHHYFGEVEKSGIDWFNGSSEIQPPQALNGIVKDLAHLEDVKQKIQNAIDLGASVVEIEGQLIDISNPDDVEKIIATIQGRFEDDWTEPSSDDIPKDMQEKAVVGIKDNDEIVNFTAHLKTLLTQVQNFSTENLKRSPFPHQQEGISWLLSHFESQAKFNQKSGALLADDMGLGKTYMTLVAIAEKYQRDKAKDAIQKPVLVVAPLSLLENWRAEIDETFKVSPFNDIVILQSDADLKRFKQSKGNETKQKFDEEEILSIEQIRFALKVGKSFGNERLDMPKRLVLTTYQTLRDFQFSLSVIDWSVVVFDEAQNLKNPNAMQSRAAKALNADFKLLATGTPVENSLKEFWCLMDTATPGLLGAWQEFRTQYIKPILEAEDNPEVKIAIGKALREKVGDYMLRRTKAKKLKGLPEKIIYSGDKNDVNFMSRLAAIMQGVQLQKYNEIIDNVRFSNAEDKRELILSSLRNLKVTSIHHHLELSEINDIRQEALQSSKIKVMLAILDEIKQRNEKVLIFAETKKVQAYLKMLIAQQYNLEIEIINGETQAVVTARSERSRKKLIDEFQTKEGFNVMIMSPIAAGVGLTVVGANNVIHLERHWNPAKEAQATDRVYRIGQKKTVNVYLPMAIHPEIKSFDLQLHQLLSNKIDLSNAVVANPEVKPRDLDGIFN